jgi:hypothetical protein
LSSMASDLPTGIGDQRQRPRSVVHAFLEMLTHGPSYGGLQEIGMLTLIEEPVGGSASRRPVEDRGDTPF